MQLELMDLLYDYLPREAKVLFLGDKFFGTTHVIESCQKKGWSYRIRIKKNNCINNIEGIYATGDLKNNAGYGVEQAALFQKGIITNIGYLHDEGYKDPWIIAMDAKPTRETLLQYSQRWGIEAMFSDLKSRGFGLEDTNLKSTKRIARLILILSVALYCAVHIGIQTQSLKKNLNPQKNKYVQHAPSSKKS
jgi:transposase